MTGAIQAPDQPAEPDAAHRRMRRRTALLTGTGLLAVCMMLSACGARQLGGAGTPSPSESSASSVASSTGAPSALVTASSNSPASSRSPASSASAPAVVSCAARVASMSPEVKVGQLYMASTTAPTLEDALRTLVRTHHVGSVLYLQNTPSGVWPTRLTSIAIGALAPADLPILLAVDQEGGLVQRLTGPGFDTIPRATQQASASDAELRADWKRWGGQLVKAGVHYNLAPDADPVSADDVVRNKPVGSLGRNYGTDVATTAAKVAAVVRGLADAGVVSSAKHFPGLGRTTTNTDFGVAIDSVTAGTDEDLRPFKAAIEAGADSVMVSSAVYTRIDDGSPALFSSRVIDDLLRGRLGFDKVVLSDDLGAAKAVATVPTAERGTRFLAAGGDLVINTDPASVDDMIEHTVARVAGDQDFAASIDIKVARVLALKSSAGLLQCAG